MKKLILLPLTVFLFLIGCSQPENRIAIVSITPSENTSQDYSSWLNDDLNTLVPNCWNSSNFKYIDVTLKLEKRTKISRLSLYDYEGIFTDNPATIYALKGDKKTLLGTFTGEQYKKFVDIIPEKNATADAILIHKYCNNIPEKIEIFGSADKVDTLNTSNPAVITFEALSNKKLGDNAFQLYAKSTNTATPITFVSSNPGIVSLDYTNGQWMGRIVNYGTVTITAAQPAGNNFLAAADVANTMAVYPSDSVSTITGKIPIDPKRWFQLTNASNGLDGLFDGVTAVNVQTGWGKILDNYDSYYPVIDGEQIDLSGIRMFDGAGSNYIQPMTLSVITSDGQKINIAKFTGPEYNRWVGPDPYNPDHFNLQTTFKNIKYLVINSWNFFPTELEFYGSYTSGISITPAEKKSVPLNHMFGVNGFEWNFEAPNNPGNIDPQSFKAAKTFTGFRHYLDWEKLEASRGSYSFNPTTKGGWNYDVLYDSCKAAGIEVLACIKTLPDWMLDTYSSDQRDPENVPVEYGKDFSDPSSYLEQSKMAFQFAARYGSNKNVDRSLLSVNNVPRWNGDNVNTIKVGLGTVNYIECDNERDKWWKGRKAYQTAFEYAANLSAFYDGNKNTMGAGVGVKNADPNMKVVMAGTALASTDYLKGMVDWCRRNRGYNANGSINLCWDVINYHLYSNDSKSSQNGNATRGAAPEVSGAADVAKEFLQAAHQYCNDMPVWVTELGYDINQGSAFKAIPVGNKSALETQADWILRSSLMYARSGIDRIFFYEMYDDNVWNSQQFSSSGLINVDKTRKPAADFLYQVNKLFGDYSYQETLNDFPIVDHYKSNNNSMYMVVVPDEKGSTGGYLLDLGNATSAQIFTPKEGSDNMEMKMVTIDNGKLYVHATETPIFITPVTSLDNQSVEMAMQNNISAKNQELKNTVTVYPNPAADYVNVVVNNNNNSDIKIKIFGTSGNVFKNFEFNKQNSNFYQSINISSLPVGYYMVEINQGKNKIVKKIFKSHQ